MPGNLGHIHRSGRRGRRRRGKDAEHVEKRLAGSGRGVHGLFGGSEMGALVFECRDDELEITHRARQAVDARDHQCLTGMDEIEDGPKFGTAREGGAVAGLGADHGAACGLKRRHLGIEILIPRSRPWHSRCGRMNCSFWVCP